MSKFDLALPAFKIGPYTLKCELTPKNMFGDKRRVLEMDWTAGIIKLSNTLAPRKVLETIMRAIVISIHNRSGLNDKSDEESFTHSLATGLIELVQNNPAFWIKYQQLLEDEYRPNSGWSKAASGQLLSSLSTRPQRVICNQLACQLEWVSEDKWTGDAYGLYFINQRRIKILDTLHGTNLALVLLHEVIHFLHESYLLTDKHSEQDFVNTQSLMLLRFMQQNPKFWAWWMYTAVST